MEQHEAAIDDFTEAIRLNPGYYEAYGNRGAAKTALGKLDDAIDDFGEIIRLRPNDPFAHSNRGSTYALLGRTAEARADFETAQKAAKALGDAGLAAYVAKALRRIGNRSSD